MRATDRTLDSAPFILAALLIAGVVHIVSVLLMPALAPRDAMARLVEAARSAPKGPGGAALLPAMEPGAETLPFEDPALAEGVCLYDLSKGLLRVRAEVDGEDFLGLSFHAVAGRLYHALTDRAAVKGKIEMVIGDAAQIEALESADRAETPLQETRIVAPTKRGFVLIRSLTRRASDQARARARVGAVICEILKLPEE